MFDLYCDYDAPAFYSAINRVARKEHKCCECKTPIHRGEKYVECTGKWEGDVETFRQHVDCCAACMRIRDVYMGGEECVPFGALMETYFNEREGRVKDAEFRVLMAKILRRRRAHGFGKHGKRAGAA